MTVTRGTPVYCWILKELCTKLVFVYIQTAETENSGWHCGWVKQCCQHSHVLADIRVCVLHFIHIRILFYTSPFPYDRVPVVVHVPQFDKPWSSRYETGFCSYMQRYTTYASLAGPDSSPPAASRSNPNYGAHQHALCRNLRWFTRSHELTDGCQLIRRKWQISK